MSQIGDCGQSLMGLLTHRTLPKKNHSEPPVKPPVLLVRISCRTPGTTPGKTPGKTPGIFNTGGFTGGFTGGCSGGFTGVMHQDLIATHRIEKKHPIFVVLFREIQLVADDQMEETSCDLDKPSS